MRIYRDIRCSKNKTPYKSCQSIIYWEGDGKKTVSPAFYFGFDATGDKMYAGMSGFPKAILTGYRNAVIDEAFILLPFTVRSE